MHPARKSTYEVISISLQLYQKKILAQVFSCEYWKNFQERFYRTYLVFASAKNFFMWFSDNEIMPNAENMGYYKPSHHHPPSPTTTINIPTTSYY